mmetsp:Transcript_111625/g.360179  ORF Transcript_111625/g.360179 Transcript_111625/m.360179 type:complete len:427 (+) Transcript_111625:630-1910(+)
MTCDDIRLGFHIRVVGNCGELGDWSPADGLALHTSVEDLPRWTSREPIVVKDGVVVEYKYVICNSDVTGTQWEEGPNRQVVFSELAGHGKGPCTVVTEAFDIRGGSTAERFSDEDFSSQLNARVPAGPQVDTDAPGASFSACYSLVGDRPIGEGSFACVWRCVPAKGGSDELAAKVVSKSKLQPRDFKNLLGPHGEIETHLSLNHPHIVSLIEFFDEPEAVIMVMECCHGGDLFDAIDGAARSSGRGLSEAATARMMQHLLSALACIHQMRIVHRDLKAENVLLSLAGVPAEENIYKLCDFGFAARDSASGNGLADRVGSPFSVAPEVIEGKAYGCAVDLWSAGVLMFMALSSRPPFDAPTSPEVLRLVSCATYSLDGPLWESVSAPCKKLLTSLLTKTPGWRPSAQKALTHPWFEQRPHRAGRQE